MDRFRVDRPLSRADPLNYDGLLLPGGVANPDRLRTIPEAIRFVERFVTDRKPVAAICHGPWLLVEADTVRDRTLTSWPSLRTDIRNAGGDIMNTASPHSPGALATPASLVTWTNAVYALHAVSLVMGIIGTATVIGAFLTGWPSIIAVIMNYLKRREAQGTWLASHFRWQLRTFWFGVLWVALCALFVVLTLGIGMLIAWLPLGFVTVWFIYRIVRGWIRLSRRRPMYT